MNRRHNVLHILNTSEDDICKDYNLSAGVYQNINDHSAMVGALRQLDLDPKIFLGAPVRVMRETISEIKREYGSIDGYLDTIGFGEEWRNRLRRACGGEDTLFEGTGTEQVRIVEGSGQFESISDEFEGGAGL